MSSGPDRRGLSVDLAICIVLLASYVACRGDAARGPVPIAFGRDTDDRCRMVIHDRRFAAEVRDAGGHLWKFDDIGCALAWMAAHGVGEDDAGVEVWVADRDSGDWLDARRARYAAGDASPMRYQSGAIAAAAAAGADFHEMQRAVLARGR